MKSLEIHLVPLRIELVQHEVEPSILPLRLAHDVEIVVRQHVGFDTFPAKELCVVVGIVRDVADVEDSHKRTPLMLMDPPHSPYSRMSFLEEKRTGLVKQI